MEKPRRSYPADERFYVLRDGVAHGPCDIETLLEGIEAGEFVYEDLCLPESGGAPEPLRDLLDWEDHPVDDKDVDEEDEDEDFEEGRNLREAPAPGKARRRSGRRDPVLYRGHQSILTYPWSSLAFSGALVGAAWVHPLDSRGSLALFAVACGALGYLVLMRYLREYFVTTRRIEAVTGLIARSCREVRISDIRAINVVCRGLSGCFGIGTVEFYTTGDRPEVEFRKVWAAARIKRLVRDLQDEAEF